jgi:HD-like signal output (HDOD) protein
MEDDQRIQAILASGIKIPPMPAIFLRLNTLLRDPDAGPVELAALVRDDGALSGAIFRVVGSPVFGLHAKVDSLPRAVSLLGMRNTAALVRSEALRAALGDPRHARALQQLWNRGAAIAALCVLAAKTARLGWSVGLDAAYLLGMFHDCGLALLCKRFPAYASALAESDAWPDILELDRAHQLSHAVIGQMVAKNWALPDELVVAIRYHHDPQVGELPAGVRRLVAMLDFATHLHSQAEGLDDAEWTSRLHGDCMRHFDLDAASLAAWEEKIRADSAFPNSQTSPAATDSLRPSSSEPFVRANQP